MTNEAKKVGLSKEQLDDIQKIVSEMKTRGCTFIKKVCSLLFLYLGDEK